MIVTNLLIACNSILIYCLSKKIDTAIELIYNRLNIDKDIWGGENNE